MVPEVLKLAKMKNLTASQINEVIKPTFNSGLLIFKKGEHYGNFLGNVKFIPSTIAQAKKQVSALKKSYGNNLLMCGEWNSLEAFLNKNGFKGRYDLTKSKTMCRITNISDLILAIKKEFNF